MANSTGIQSPGGFCLSILYLSTGYSTHGEITQETRLHIAAAPKRFNDWRTVKARCWCLTRRRESPMLSGQRQTINTQQQQPGTDHSRNLVNIYHVHGFNLWDAQLSRRQDAVGASCIGAHARRQENVSSMAIVDRVLEGLSPKILAQYFCVTVSEPQRLRGSERKPARYVISRRTWLRSPHPAHPAV